jgi:hypothetical protein
MWRRSAHPGPRRGLAVGHGINAAQVGHRVLFATQEHRNRHPALRPGREHATRKPPHSSSVESAQSSSATDTAGPRAPTLARKRLSQGGAGHCGDDRCPQRTATSSGGGGGGARARPGWPLSTPSSWRSGASPRLERFYDDLGARLLQPDPAHPDQAPRGPTTPTTRFNVPPCRQLSCHSGNLRVKGPSTWRQRQPAPMQGSWREGRSSALPWRSGPRDRLRSLPPEPT